VKTRFKSFFFILFLSLALAPSAFAQDGAQGGSVERELENLRLENEEIRKRLDAVELEGEETKHNFGSISRFVEVSGYADAEFYFTDNDSENSRFRIRHLSLFFLKDIQEDWKLFTEIEYEDAPLIESAHTTDDPATVQGKLFVEQMYIEYHPDLSWDVRFGRFLTPAGIWNIYHYPPYVPTQQRPLMVRQIFPQVSDGIQARYSHSFGGPVLDTHLYAANGAGNPGRLDRNEQKAVGARFNLEYGPWWAGASLYGERDNSGIKRSAWGLHLLANYSPFKFQAEYQYRDNDMATGSDFIDRGFYAQGIYDIGRWTLAARYDWYDPDSGLSDADLFRYTGAVNYHFAENVVAKAEYNRNDLEDGEDFNEVILSIVVAIGDL
jgi:predicted porin